MDASFSSPSPSDDSIADDFAPVPVARRRDGWTVERQRAFIAELAESGDVAMSARLVGMSERSVFRLRARPDAADFSAAWDAALQMAGHRLLAAAFELALTGARRRVWHQGEVVGMDYVRSERLLMFLLRGFDPVRFGALSGVLDFAAPDPHKEAGRALAQLDRRLVDLPDAPDPSSLLDDA